ncbi:uncharacterized protein [Lepisosteus oculatus]|uniref:uncharacterized protein n=1 Tax=Lepisosteus oculatus TaxID=7918 RepID=UPI0035F52F1B
MSGLVEESAKEPSIRESLAILSAEIKNLRQRGQSLQSELRAFLGMESSIPGKRAVAYTDDKTQNAQLCKTRIRTSVRRNKTLRGRTHSPLVEIQLFYEMSRSILTPRTSNITNHYLSADVGAAILLPRQKMIQSQKGPRNLPEAIPGFQTEYNVATVGEKITESSSQIAQSQPQHPVLTEADKVVKQEKNKRWYHTLLKCMMPCVYSRHHQRNRRHLSREQEYEKTDEKKHQEKSIEYAQSRTVFQ